jgi:hypothetical protein
MVQIIYKTQWVIDKSEEQYLLMGIGPRIGRLTRDYGVPHSHETQYPRPRQYRSLADLIRRIAHDGRHNQLCQTRETGKASDQKIGLVCDQIHERTQHAAL